MGIYKDWKIKMLEDSHSLFWRGGGLDMCGLLDENSDNISGFSDYVGEYYKKPTHFRLGNDMVYKKKQEAGEIPAEVILGYAYNMLGIPSPVAYPYFIKAYLTLKDKKRNMSDVVLIPDGVISKDVLQVYPTAVKRGDRACHTIHGLFSDRKCRDEISPKGRMARIKETIASIAFNNKDAGFDNSFWIKNTKTGKLDGVVSIDHGYSGRHSMYYTPYNQFVKHLYCKGEHGYNGMFHYEEDRGTAIYFIRQLMLGKNVCGVQLTEGEIAELKDFVYKIKQINFQTIKEDFAKKFKFECSSAYMQGLEWSREDLCESLTI